MPLGYEVFDGNTTDVTTVKTIIGTMEARYGLARRIWVMDRPSLPMTVRQSCSSSLL
jgi:transposase